MRFAMTERHGSGIPRWLKFAVAIVAVASGLGALYFGFAPSSSRSEADLRIVAAHVEEEDGNSRIILKLINQGGTVAFISEGSIEFQAVLISEDDGHYAAEVEPVNYDWLILQSDTASRVSKMPLSRRIDPNDVDQIEFTLGYEVPRRSISGTVRVRLDYNQGKSAKTEQLRIAVSNEVGRVPKFRGAPSSREINSILTSALPAPSLVELVNEATIANNPNVARAVRSLLEHDNARVRTAAVEYFGVVSRPRFAPILAQMILDADSSVVAAAKRTLATYGDHALPELRSLMKTSEPERREVAMAIAAAIGGDSAEDVLRIGLRDVAVSKTVFGQEVLVAETSVRGLAQIGSPTAIAAIRDLLHAKDERLQLISIHALAELRDREALPILEDLSPGASAVVREAAADAVAHIRRD